jgi:hypothetical protein
MDRPNRPDWRKQGRGSAPRREPAARERSSKWQDRRVDAVQTAAFYHRLRMIALSLGALGLIVAFVIAVLYVPKQTSVITLTVWQYDAAWPPNSYAAEDLKRLQRADHPNGNFQVLADDFSGSVAAGAALDHLEKQLSSVSPGGPGKNTVIVYLSAHGVVNEANEPCLLFSDAGPLQSDTWLPLEQVLDVFRRFQANSSKSNQRVLLILDAGRIDQRWNAGLLVNAFPEQLAASVARAGIPGLHVLTACGPGETAWASPEMDGTAFGLFVARGLNGDAAGGDNVVTLLELYRYVQRNVGNWSLNHRASVQQPMLIPEISDSEDFGLVYAGQDLRLLPDAQQQTARLEQLHDTRQQIDRLWQQADRVRTSRSLVRNDPLGLADLQHRLLRADELLWSGAAYQSELNDLLNAIQVQLDTVGSTPLPSGVKGLSLPLAMQVQSPPEDDAARAGILAAWRAAGGRPVPKEGEPPPAPPSYLAAADIGFAWLAGLPQVSAAQLREVLDWVRSAPRGAASPAGARATADTPDAAEVQLMRMLLAHVDWPADVAGGQLEQNVAAALASRRAAERSAAPADLRVHWWIQSLVDATDAQRRLAEDLLYLSSTSAISKAAGMLDTLLSDQGDGGSYRHVVQRADTVAGYYAARDAAWAELPYLAGLVAARARLGTVEGLGGDTEQAWDRLARLVAAAQRLSAELDRCLAEQAGEPSPGLAEAADEVTTSHRELKDSFLQYCDYLERQAGQDRPTLLRIGQVLRVPLLDAGRRVSLNEKYQQILFSQVNLQDIEQSAKDERRPPLAANVVAESRQRIEEYRKRLAAWDFHPVLMLLDRREMNLLPEERTEVQRGRQSAASDDAWLARQGGRVRELYADLLVKLNDLDAITKRRLEQADETPANIRAGLSQADRLARAAAPLMGTRTWVQAGMDPAHRLRLVDLHFAMRWQAWRALEDFWGSADDSPGTPYFARAAETYLTSARLLDKTPRRLLYGGSDIEALLKSRRQAAQATVVSVRDALSLRTDATVPHEMQVRWAADVPDGIAAAFVARPFQASEPMSLLPVRDAGGQFTMRRSPVRAPNHGSPADAKYQIPLDDLKSAASGAELDAVCLYRGHLVRQRFRILWPPWVTRVAVPPRNPDYASVTVEGEGQKTGHLMFIFDCSGSMQERGRMRNAKSSMQSVLGSLLAAGRYEVGLAGVRAASQVYRPQRLCQESVCQSRVRGHRPPRPGRGTDAAHPDAGQGTPRGAAGQGRRPAAARPNAAVPVTQAGLCRRRFRSRARGRAEATDRDHRRPEFPDELSAHRESPGTADDDAGGAGGAQSGGQIAGHPDRYHRAGHGRDARPACRTDPVGRTDGRPVLRRQEHGEPDPSPAPDAAVDRVHRHRTGSGIRRPYAAGTGRDVAAAPGAASPNARTKCRLPGATASLRESVQIEGGEALLLRYDGRRSRLFYPPYEPKKFDPKDDLRGEPQICQAPDGSGTFRVQSLLPRRNAKDVEFYVSVQQRDDLKFTFRPKHVWAEIRPLDGDSQRVYHFADPDFVPERPVPVFRFLAKDWPATVEEAEIRLWFKLDAEAVQPDWTGPAADPDRTSSFEVASLPGVAFEIGSQALGGGSDQRDRHPAPPARPARQPGPGPHLSAARRPDLPRVRRPGQRGKARVPVRETHLDHRRHHLERQDRRWCRPGSAPARGGA